MNKIKTTAFCAVAACILLFGGFACNSSDNYLGTYQAVDKSAQTQKENIIELLENGEGAWVCCDNEVLFSWYVKGNELRINTKEGGIMVGKLKKDSFIITLPGNKQLKFVKISSEE